MRTIIITVLMLLQLFLVGCSKSIEFTELGLASDCDVAKNTCKVSHDRTDISMALGKDVIPLKPFDAVVTIDGIKVEPGSVIADFQMQGMDMGVNRYRMVGDSGMWSGKITLPVCTASRMDWTAIVEFTSSDGQRFRARFLFETAIP